MLCIEKLATNQTKREMSVKNGNNHHLITACRRGDARAWQQLVAQYGRLVHSIPVRYGLSPAEVDDVGQEVFLALAQGLDQITDPEALPAWLITTARRHSWRVLQKRKREQPMAAADLAAVAAPESDASAEIVRHFGPQVPSMHELLQGWQSQETLAQGFDKLGDRCRTLLTAIFLDPAEPSYETISEQLGIAKGSIGPTRNRCLQQLRQILEGLGFASEDL